MSVSAEAGPRYLALIGTPNSGKTALFNALTGSRQKVANYPGVTVERKAGALQTPSGRSVNVIDLPGTYSLTAYSIEEIIARRQPNETITIVVPEFVPSERWHNLLHMQTAKLLRSELLSKPGVVVTNVPYQVF
jgi:ferrous iron transport protein B